MIVQDWTYNSGLLYRVLQVVWVRTYYTHVACCTFLDGRRRKCELTSAWRWETLFLPCHFHATDKPLPSIDFCNLKEFFLRFCHSRASFSSSNRNDFLFVSTIFDDVVSVLWRTTTMFLMSRRFHSLHTLNTISIYYRNQVFICF
jgi:hypothetical protein